MSERKEYRWVKGNGREPKFAEGTGDLINFSLNLKDIAEMVKANPEKHKDGWVQLEMARKKNGADQWGNTHGIRENSYTPKKKEDDLPF